MREEELPMVGFVYWYAGRCSGVECSFSFFFFFFPWLEVNVRKEGGSFAAAVDEVPDETRRLPGMEGFNLTWFDVTYYRIVRRRESRYRTGRWLVIEC